MTLQDKIKPNGQKKLLTLDGGGIRGLITIEILAKMEDVLRSEMGREKSFVLADYFDYVSGTSTGAIMVRLRLKNESLLKATSSIDSRLLARLPFEGHLLDPRGLEHEDNNHHSCLEDQGELDRDGRGRRQGYQC